MGKRRKKRKSSKCPEPINSMINLAGGLAMGAVAAHMESKYHYTDKGKPNPYAVTAVGFATGSIKGTRDIVRLGAVMGAMGAFDAEQDDSNKHRYIPQSNCAEDDDAYFDALVYPSNDRNKYAWRLNCEDGSEYGIYPEDYETRDEYHEALHQEKYSWRDYCEDGTEHGIDPEDYETEEEYEEAMEAASSPPIVSMSTVVENTTVPESSVKRTPSAVPPIEQAAPELFEDDDFHVFIYCKVETEEGTDYYRTEDRSIRRGNKVIVPSNQGDIEGIVISVEHHMRFSVPKELNRTTMIKSVRTTET